MSLPRYPEYKDSGVEWLGEVPEHWESWRLSHAFGAIGSGTTPPSDEPEWYADGTVPWVTTGELRETAIYETTKAVTKAAVTKFSALRIHPAGSLAIAMYGATIGRLGILGVDATTNQACCVLSCPRNLDTRFVFHWLLGFKQNLIDLYATGGGQPNINQEIIASLRIPAPGLSEQTTIANFLDRETAKIDGLIAEQEKLIALLAEKRQATISHAVTKGLNPAAPMKDSGVAWLGEVPAHWNVGPLGIICSLIQTGPFGSQLHAEDYVEDGTPVVNPSNLFEGKIVPDWKCSVAAEMVNALPQHVLRVGDIVFGRRGEMGRCALVKAENAGWLCGTGSLNLRLKTGNPRFVVTYLATPTVRELLKLESVGSTMDNLNAGILSRVRVPLPPDAEQLEIIAFLDSEISLLDALTTEATRAITLLKERRSALISAAVTGKIDVRGVGQ